ncbi:MAG: hypothetical protein JW704_02570, partial [Anaerolineaceae bacterium]|nr:hypothetical protein [Anaerolineaceae bacterium]
ASGQAVFTLPVGAYRFRADVNGTQYWSGAENHCMLPGCESALVVAGVAYLPDDDMTNVVYGKFAASLIAQSGSNPVTITVLDTSGNPVADLNAYAFNGVTYSGYHGTTDGNGQLVLYLPDGSYRFRVDRNGTQFWSGLENHCILPGCDSATITVTIPLVITVNNTDGIPVAGLNVYAFSDSVYTGYHGLTEENGTVVLTLPQGDYRFRADLNGTQFWSGDENHCTLPGCDSASITVTIPVSVSVIDTNGQPAAGLNVYAFSDSVYTGYHSLTDEYGMVVLTLPQGDYRFRADLNGTQFWSDAVNHCALPGCGSAAITVTIPLTVAVINASGLPFEGLHVYAFNGTTYAGYSRVTDSAGQVVFTLPAGDYHFRADYDSVPFWSGTENHCSIPDCTQAVVRIPGGGLVSEISRTIDYVYDPLGRLTSAVYTDDNSFAYTYDRNGNVLEYQSTIKSQSSTTVYSYDGANQLLTGTKDGVEWNYSYDGNGSLIESTPAGSSLAGAIRYSYNTAGFLVSVENHDGSAWQDQAEMAYDGLGQRLSMTAWAEGVSATTNYELDNGRVLTATAGELVTTYLYGMGPIAELTDAWAYSLPDGTNTQRQLTDSLGEVTLMTSYTPWGDTLTSYGSGSFTFGYFGGIMDAATGLIYIGNGLYYDPATGRFLNRNANPDSTNPYVPWSGDPAGAMMSPLVVLALAFSFRKKRGKWDTLIVILVVGLSLSIGLSACDQPPQPEDPIQSDLPQPVVHLQPISTTTPIATLTATITATLPAPTGVVIELPIIRCHPILPMLSSFLLWEFGITALGFTQVEESIFLEAANYTGTKLAPYFGYRSVEQVFKEAHGEIEIVFDASANFDGWCEVIGHKITCDTTPDLPAMIHEFGHVFENHFSSTGRNASDWYPYRYNDVQYDYDENLEVWTRTTDGFKCSDARCLAHRPSMGYVLSGGTKSYDQTSWYARIEHWADMYMNWVMDFCSESYHGFTNDDAGNGRRKIMDQQLHWVITGKHRN